MKCYTIFASVGVVLSSALAFAQSPQRTRGIPKSPPNSWMQIPSEASLPDVVLPSSRYQRDEFWDGLIGDNAPLSPESAKGAGISEGLYVKEPQEIPEIPHRVVLAGVFTGWRSVLTASGRAIYTEVTVHVSHVFEDTGHAMPDGDITITVPGGTVKTLGGQLISYLTQPRSFFMQPKHTYLLVLSYHTDGDFYAFGKDFDISDGVVRADSAWDRRREEQGRSSLVGETTEEMIRSLGATFSKAR